MPEIIPFDFHSYSVRAVTINGDPWFVARDVASILGYSNPLKAVRDHCKGVNETVIPSAGGAQTVKIIPERDVYRLVMRSQMPSAEQFEDWVVSEVLPSSRKTGAYDVQPQFNVPQTLSDALRLAADQADTIEAQQRQIEHQKPAVEFVERYVEARSAKSLREVAKVLGIKEREFITKLVDDRIMFRQSGNLLPFASYHHRGFFEVKTGESNGYAYQQARFTPKGIAWISKRLGLVNGEGA